MSTPAPPSSIVVPLDGSDLADRALPVAAALARALAVPVTLLSAGQRAGEPVPDAELARRASRLRELGVSQVVSSVQSGTDPVGAIVGASGPGVAVCMATHGRAGLRKAVLGSVAEAVLRAVREPVLLVGPATREPGGSGPLVLTVDGSDTSVSIVPHALGWAAGLGWEVAVVTVTRPGGRFREGPPAAVDGVVDGVVARCRDAGRRARREVLQADDVAGAIVDFAANVAAPMVAMATHGRSGLARTALGSVAADVVRRAPCPVLVVRPAA